MKQIVKSFTGLVGLALFAYLFVFYAAEISKVWNAQRSGTVHSTFDRDNDRVFVFQKVDPKDFLEPPIPAVGDTLVSLADTAVTRDVLRKYLASPNPVGTEVPFTFLQDGRELRGVIRLSEWDVSTIPLLWILQILRFVTSLLFVAVALWAFFKRPDSAAVRSLALYSFAMASFLMGSIQVTGEQWASFKIPWADIIRTVLDVFSSFFTAFWLNLALLFPRPLPFLIKRPSLTYILCYSPILLVSIPYTIMQILGRTTGVFGNVVLFAMMAQVIASFVILGLRYTRSADRVEKRQTRLVFWGTGASLVTLVILLTVFLAFRNWFAEDISRALIVINFAFIGLLFTPASFVYAFNRYRLLEVEGKLRRGTRYMAAFVGVMGAIAAIGFLVGVLFKQFLGDFGGNLALFVSVLAAFGVVPLLRHAQRILERTFYPERQRLRELIRDFLTNANALADKKTFWAQLEDRLRDGLMVEGVYPILRGSSNGSFYLRDTHATPFYAGSELLVRLEREQRPLMVDEIIASRIVRLSTEEVDWFSINRVAILLPLITHGRLTGFLGLGMKTEKEDYAPEELRILNSLTSQVAVASENIRLLEENVDKRRLEEQLQMARRIQHGFLPRQIPETPGIDVAAITRFCLEVAGDYYDIIPLASGETVLAVGDVSGKGAGAALIMANLQASLRTAVGVGIPLSEVVARINDLICSNTPPEDYITFFVSIFDPRRNTLTYVNAGHNPPLLLRSDQQIETLDVGGIIIGMMCGVHYEQSEVCLGSGDILLLYTDGVSEAMNAEDEEFGEQQIRDYLAQNHRADPADALAGLERRVLDFHGDSALEDDFTLLFARVR